MRTAIGAPFPDDDPDDEWWGKYVDKDHYRQLIEALDALGVSIEIDSVEQTAAELGVPYVNLEKSPPDPAAIALVPAHICRRHNVIPLRRDAKSNVLWVAMADVNSPYAADDIRMASRHTIRALLADKLSIRTAINTCYPQG
jgi:type IV pilus assembly protein PilB